MKKLFYLTILTVLFVSGISAKSLTSVQTRNKMIISHEVLETLTLAGVQSEEGLADSGNDTRLGNTFVLTGGNENVSVSLTISMNYTAAEPDIERGNKVIGGTWTMTVYKNGVYFGVMYGSVSGGAINWQMADDVLISRQTDVQLDINGGLDGYANSVSYFSDNKLSAITNFLPKGEQSIEATLDLPL